MTIQLVFPVANDTIMWCSCRVDTVIGPEELQKHTSLIAAEVCCLMDFRDGGVWTQRSLAAENVHQECTIGIRLHRGRGHAMRGCLIDI